MLQISEDMLRAHRRHDAGGRPVTKAIANEIEARSVLAKGTGRARAQAGGEGVLRSILSRLTSAFSRSGPTLADQRS